MHNAISVLDGGLPRWKFHGFPIKSGEPGKPEQKEFRAKFTPQLLRTYSEMLENHSSQKEQVSLVNNYYCLTRPAALQ